MSQTSGHPLTTQIPDMNTQLLIEAREKFFFSVSGSDLELFSKCSSHAEFLADIRKLEVISHQGRQGAKLLKKIEKFSKGLEQYFKVIEMMISSNPEFAAIGWGVFRLILQLASGFVTFFEKLAKVIEKIADVLPQYQDIMRIVGERPSERLKSSLCQVYGDFFQFFQGVSRVFTKGDGKIKRTPAVIGTLFWKPFDARFTDLLGQLEYHKELLRDEIAIHQYQASHDFRAAEVEERRKAADARHAANISYALTSDIRDWQKKEALERTIDKIRRWLAPSEFMREYEQAQSLMEDNTATWLFDEPKFLDWRSSHIVSGSATNERYFDNRVLWVKGNPGTGKTILASSAISELRSTEGEKLSDRPLTCFFFFSQTSHNKSSFPVSALRAILAQILHMFQTDDAFISKLSFAMSEVTGGQKEASHAELLELVELCFMDLPNLVVVLDAVDECEDSASLIGTIGKLCHQSTAKFLLFSRPNVSELLHSVQDKYRLETDRRSTQPDIKLYLERHIEDLRSDGLLPSPLDTANLVRHLLKGADGMFLWGRLMISYLNSPALAPTQRVNAIMEVNLPEGLELMYERIFGLILQKDRAQQDLAKRVFIWLAHAKWQLNSRELQAAVLAGAKVTGDSSYTDLNLTVTMSCGGLVETFSNRPTHYQITSSTTGGEFKSIDSETDYSFKFIHLSVLEFFTAYTQINHPLNPLHRLLSTEPQAHFEMLKSCLYYLTYRTPSGPLSGRSDFSSNYFTVSRMFPFLRYATRNWIQHLSEIVHVDERHTSYILESRNNQVNLSTSQWTEVLQYLSIFLGKKRVVMAWLEAFFTFPDIRALEYEKLADWSEWAVRFLKHLTTNGPDINCFEMLSEFSDVLKKINCEWHSILCEKPFEVWVQMPDFVSTKFFESSGTTSVTFIAPKLPEWGTKFNLCQSPLATISETRANGIETAVLSVWTSQDFEVIQKSLTPSDSCLKLRGVCVGWVARYEIWTVLNNESSIIYNASIDLDEGEIWLQIRQSMRQDIMNTWKMQFPLSISDDLRTFSILRTIFNVSVNSMHGTEIISTMLPMEIKASSSRNWSDEKIGFGPTLNHRAPLNLQLVTHDLYEYSVKVGPAGRFVAICEVGLIVVFKLETISGTFTAIPENRVRCEIQDKEFTFHPLRPLLAITSVDKVIVWCFLSGRGDSTDLIGIEGSKTMKVTFSACGKHLVLDSSNHRPSIHPLEDAPVYRALETYSRDIPDEKKQELMVSSENPTPSLLSSVLEGGNSIRHDVMTVNDRLGSMEVHAVNRPDSSGGIQLSRYFTHDPQSIESICLSILPQWQDMKNAKTVTRMPEKSGDSLKIILNKESTRWNHFATTAESHLPVIIQRDPRSIDSNSASAPNSKRQKLDKDGGISFGDKLMARASKLDLLAGGSSQRSKSVLYKSSDPFGYHIRSDGQEKNI